MFVVGDGNAARKALAMSRPELVEQTFQAVAINSADALAQRFGNVRLRIVRQEAHSRLRISW